MTLTSRVQSRIFKSKTRGDQNNGWIYLEVLIYNIFNTIHTVNEKLKKWAHPKMETYDSDDMGLKDDKESFSISVDNEKEEGILVIVNITKVKKKTMKKTH